MVAASYFVVADAPLRQGGGEPSLASREDPYGSLRMPLSICVILRIYNEDAIRVSFFLFIDCATFAPCRSAFFLPGPFAPFYYRSFYLSLSSLFSLFLFVICLHNAESTQVSSSSLPSLQSPNRRTSWCFMMVIIVVPPKTTFEFYTEKVTTFDDKTIHFIHFF